METATQVAYRVRSHHSTDTKVRPIQQEEPALPSEGTSPRPATRRGRSESAHPEHSSPVQGEDLLRRDAPSGASLLSTGSRGKYRRSAPGPLLAMPASHALDSREDLMEWNARASPAPGGSPQASMLHPRLPSRRHSSSVPPSPSGEGAAGRGEAAEADERLLNALSLSPLPRSRAGGRIKSALKSLSRTEGLARQGSPRRVHWCESVMVITWYGTESFTPGRIINKI